MTLSIGWFSAGRGAGSLAMLKHLLRAIESGSIDAEIGFALVHRERGEGEGSDTYIDFLEAHGIPTRTISSKRFREEHAGNFADHRNEFDERLAKIIEPFESDICVLAGYLLIVSPELTRGRTFINLHPSLPGGPIGLWQKVVWDLIEQRANETGAMMFRVTEELDAGPPIAYARTSLTGPGFDSLWQALIDIDKDSTHDEAWKTRAQPLFDAIRRAEISLEPPLVAGTLQLLANEGLSLLASTRCPIDLTASIDTSD